MSAEADMPCFAMVGVDTNIPPPFRVAAAWRRGGWHPGRAARLGLAIPGALGSQGQANLVDEKGFRLIDSFKSLR